MYIHSEKIKKLIELYGEQKGYPEKSHLPKFCEDNNLNYTQWNTYTRGKQNIGIKIVDLLIDIFPNLNLNWLLKDEPNVFVYQNAGNIAEEPAPEYNKEISNEDLMNKLLKMEKSIDKIASKFK